MRQALLSLAEKLLLKCSFTLEPGLKSILNILIALSVDEYDVISDEATKHLEKFVENCDEESVHDLKSHVRKSLYHLCKSLGTTLGLYETEKLERTLALLRGYLQFLFQNQSHSKFSFSQTHLNNLVQSLILVTKLEPESTLMIVETGQDFSSLDFLFNPEFLSVKKPEKQFCHLTKLKLIKLVEDIFRIL